MIVARAAYASCARDRPTVRGAPGTGPARVQWGSLEIRATVAEAREEPSQPSDPIRERSHSMPERIISEDHHPSLRHADRRAIGAELQAVLITLTDLSLAGKQAHWNLVGRLFRPLHLFLDELIDGWRAAADEVAERAVALGYSPDARAQTVADSTPLDAL